MRTKNQALMDRIIQYTDDYYVKNGHSPNITEIADALKVNKSQIHRYLIYMEEQGTVEYSRGMIKTPMIMKIGPSNYTGIVGSIPCGQPDERVSEVVEEYVSLPVSLFGNGELYILRANGDSMIEAGIDHGDLVVVRKTDDANIGDIVAAVTPSGETTLKRLKVLDGRRVLHPENSSMSDILTPFRIQGVAIYVMKKVGCII